MRRQKTLVCQMLLSFDRICCVRRYFKTSGMFDVAEVVCTFCEESAILNFKVALASLKSDFICFTRLSWSQGEGKITPM